MQELLTSHALGVQFIHLDLKKMYSIDDIDRHCGPLDVLLHKLSHDMVMETVDHDAEAIKNMRLIQAYISRYPSVRVIDPFEGVRLLTNREDVCKMLSRVSSSYSISLDHGHSSHFHHHSMTKRGFHFSPPRYAVVKDERSRQELLTRIRSGDFSLPIIAKSIEATGNVHVCIVHNDMSQRLHPSHHTRMKIDMTWSTRWNEIYEYIYMYLCI
jgi:hypothetical protein